MNLDIESLEYDHQVQKREGKKLEQLKKRECKKFQQVEETGRRDVAISPLFIVYAVLLCLAFISKGYAIYPDTWKCSKCNYENYEGINDCAVCGQSR